MHCMGCCHLNPSGKRRTAFFVEIEKYTIACELRAVLWPDGLIYIEFNRFGLFAILKMRRLPDFSRIGLFVRRFRPDPALFIRQEPAEGRERELWK